MFYDLQALHTYTFFPPTAFLFTNSSLVIIFYRFKSNNSETFFIITINYLFPPPRISEKQNSFLGLISIHEGNIH